MSKEFSKIWQKISPEQAKGGRGSETHIFKIVPVINMLHFGVHVFSKCVSCNFREFIGLDAHLLL
jgi:hypothetical protein